MAFSKSKEKSWWEINNLKDFEPHSQHKCYNFRSSWGFGWRMFPSPPSYLVSFYLALHACAFIVDYRLLHVPPDLISKPIIDLSFPANFIPFRYGQVFWERNYPREFAFVREILLHAMCIWFLPDSQTDFDSDDDSVWSESGTESRFFCAGICIKVYLGISTFFYGGLSDAYQLLLK